MNKMYYKKSNRQNQIIHSQKNHGDGNEVKALS